MKICGMMVVGSGEADRYLNLVLDRMRGLVDVLVVWGVAPDAKTEAMLASYPYVEYHRDETHAWADYQPQIKYSLLTKFVLPHRPDWIVSLDADEVFDPRITREVLEEMAGRGEIAFSFYCVQLYDTEYKMRVDGVWGGFRNVRFWKPIYEIQQEWLPTKLHCGLAPVYAYAFASDSEFFFKHYGYLKESDRAKKLERYRTHDPKYTYMTPAYYDTIMAEPELREFDENKFGKELRYSPKKPKLEKVIERYKKKKMAKASYFQNKHGTVISSTDPDTIEVWRANKNMEFLYEVDVSKEKIEAPVFEPNPLECRLCPFIAKSSQEIEEHKKSHQ